MIDYENCWKNTEDEVLDGEIWLDVIKFEGYYQISNYGRVKSLDRVVPVRVEDKIHTRKINGLILKPKLDKYGYLRVCLYKDGMISRKFVHRLVLENFNPINNMEDFSVNHITGIKTMNIPKLLEWSTPREQYDHAVKIGLIDKTKVLKGEDSSLSKLTNKTVKKIYENKCNLTYIELSKEYNISVSEIANIFNKKTWTHITDSLDRNKIVKRLEKHDVVFIFTNPLNFNNKELGLLFNKNTDQIRRIFKRERHPKYTIGLIPNEVKDFGKNFYKAYCLNNVFYFTNINKFCLEHKEFNNKIILKHIKNGTLYKRYKIKICNKIEYLSHIKNIYDEYIKNKEGD